ncbi:MAG: kynureninase [Candidatus Neomarinimicrobiota bacterium]|nr:kynureninase [Candidatus Neomarinimicrobiota bacterium]
MKEQYSIHKNTYKHLDSMDPLRKFQKRFHKPKFNGIDKIIYLCGNSLGLQPIDTYDYVNKEINNWKNLGVDGHFSSERPWVTYHENLTNYTAEIVGSLNSEVVVMNSLSVNLHLLMISFYKPKNLKRKILIEQNSFPSDQFVVQSQLKYHNKDPKKDLLFLPSLDNNGLTSTDQIISFIKKYHDQISLILIGGVNYYTGQAFDIKAITKIAQEFDCIVGLDLAHAVGNIKLSLHDWGVDFAAWCGYKYLNGGPGCPSGIFIHEKHLKNKSITRFEGWWGQKKSIRFKPNMEFSAEPNAEAWQLSNPPILSMAPLISSLRIFHESGLSALRNKSIMLTGYLEFLLSEQLNKHIKIITPKEKDQRGCQLSIILKKSSHNIVMNLREHGVIIDWRDPNVMRVAPVPLYNTYEDCYKFVNILSNIFKINHSR